MRVDDGRRKCSPNDAAANPAGPLARQETLQPKGRLERRARLGALERQGQQAQLHEKCGLPPMTEVQGRRGEWARHVASEGLGPLEPLFEQRRDRGCTRPLPRVEIQLSAISWTYPPWLHRRTSTHGGLGMSLIILAAWKGPLGHGRPPYLTSQFAEKSLEL